MEKTTLVILVLLFALLGVGYFLAGNMEKMMGASTVRIEKQTEKFVLKKPQQPAANPTTPQGTPNTAPGTESTGNNVDAAAQNPNMTGNPTTNSANALNAPAPEMSASASNTQLGGPGAAGQATTTQSSASPTIESLSERLRAEPNDSYSRYKLAKLYEDQGKLNEAIQQLELSEKAVHDHWIEILTLKETVLRKATRPVDAEQAKARALKLSLPEFSN